MDRVGMQLLSSALAALGLTLVFALPMILLGVHLYRRRQRYRAQSLEPFTELPLRPPGESLRLKLEVLGDEYDSYLTVGGMILAGSATGASVLAQRLSDNLPTVLALGLVCLGSTGYVGSRMIRLQRQLWNCRLGFAGERIVGETLNRLMANGFRVFHDLPFEGFNIDHVLVGPSGVYAIETKTRRKPAALKGAAKAIVVYDGRTLSFPMGNDTHSLAQAERNAATLATWLHAATAERVRVQAILTLPGWWIERRSRGVVNVLNPREIVHSFPSGANETVLSPAQIQRIAHQLEGRCRLPAN